MPVLTEQERILTDEQNVVTITAPYTLASACDWTAGPTVTAGAATSKTYLARCDVTVTTTAGTQYGLGRICIDGVPVIGTGLISVLASSTTVPIECYVTLPAGSYTFTFEIAVPNVSAGFVNVSITNMYIGFVSFNDTTYADGDSGDTVVAGNYTTVTLLDKTVTASTARNVPIGTIKRYHVTAIVTCKSLAESVSVMKNAADANTANRVNWKVFLNGVQVDWTERVDDYQIADSTKGAGAFGRYSTSCSPLQAMQIQIKATNGFGIGVDKTCRAYVCIVCSPWILNDTVDEYITLDFPPMSTLYVVDEPLSRNSSGTVLLGKVRAASFGTATDYYAASVGTGILFFNYTYDIISTSGPILYNVSWGRCISAIGVDTR